MAEDMVNEVIAPVLSLETLEETEAPAAAQALENPEAEEFRMKQFSEEEMTQITDF